MLEKVGVKIHTRVASFHVRFNVHKRNSGFFLNCHIQIFIMTCLVQCGCHRFKMILYSDIAACELLCCAIHFLASLLDYKVLLICSGSSNAFLG